MTAKRYHKLAMSEMGKIMKGNKKAGQVLKACRKATPKWDMLPEKSYQAAWEHVRPVFVNMPYNTEATVPLK